MMTFPPHCSHKLHSFDLTVYGPLKNNYNRALTDWMISNPGKTVTIYEIPKLAAIAIPLAFKLQNIQKGFEKPGIWPLNSNTFSNKDFICSSVTDQDAPVTNEVTAVVTPEIVRPYPKACHRKLRKNVRKKGKTRILTDSPEKRLIELAEQEKQTKNKAKRGRQEKKVLKNTEKKQIPKLSPELTSNRVKKRQMSSSDSNVENVSLADSSEETFVEETSEENLDEDDVIIIDRNFQINDFVLVNFNTKKTVVHYVGRIEDISHTMATIQFIRLSKIKNTFFS